MAAHSQPESPPPPPGRAAAAAALRQARPAAVHLAPRLRPRVRARAAPGRGADGVLGRLHARTRRSATSARRPPAWPARRSTSRSALAARVRPERAPARPSSRPARRGWTSRGASPAGPARSPTGWRPRTGGSSCPASTPEACRRPSQAFLGDRQRARRAADQGRPPRRSTRGPRWSRPRSSDAGGASETPRRARWAAQLCDTRTGCPAGDARRTTRRRSRRVARRRRSRPRRAARCGAPGAGTARRGRARSATRWPPDRTAGSERRRRCSGCRQLRPAVVRQTSPAHPPADDRLNRLRAVASRLATRRARGPKWSEPSTCSNRRQATTTTTDRDPSTTRVHDLAKDLGVTSKQVLRRAAPSWASPRSPPSAR